MAKDDDEIFKPYHTGVADKLVNVDTTNFVLAAYAKDKTDFIFMTKPNKAKRKVKGNYQYLKTKKGDARRSDHPIVWFIYESTVQETKLKSLGTKPEGTYAQITKMSDKSLFGGQARMAEYDDNLMMESNDYLPANDKTGKMTLGISLFVIMCFVLMIICIASFVCGAAVSFCYLHEKQSIRDFHIV